MSKGTGSSLKAASEPRVRRGYFECRYGQLHVYHVMPAGGGFEEGTPLVCLHRSPLSGSLFEPFMRCAGRDRSVYAPDFPGFGESDPPPARPSLTDWAGSIGDFLDTMRLRQVDLLGDRLGALLAVELAVTRPKQIRRLVLTSVPLLTDTERESVRRAQQPTPPAPDGTHLAFEWQRTVQAYGPAAPPDVIARAFAERQRNAARAGWEFALLAQHALRERLSLVTQQALILRVRDELWDATGRVREVLPKARITELPEHGYGLFQLAPEVAFGAVREFLRG